MVSLTESVTQREKYQNSPLNSMPFMIRKHLYHAADSLVVKPVGLADSWLPFHGQACQIAHPIGAKEAGIFHQNYLTLGRAG